MRIHSILGVLVCGVKGYKVYIKDNDFIIKSKKKTIIVFENTPEHKITMNYVNLRYMSIKQQNEIKNDFFTKVLEI